MEELPEQFQYGKAIFLRGDPNPLLKPMVGVPPLQKEKNKQ